MSRRFPLRAAPAGAGNDWRQTIVMPPRAEAPAPDPNPDPGGECGALKIMLVSVSETAEGSCSFVAYVAGSVRVGTWIDWNVEWGPPASEFVRLDWRGDVDSGALIIEAGSTGQCVGAWGQVVLSATIRSNDTDEQVDLLTLDVTDKITCNCF